VNVLPPRAAALRRFWFGGETGAAFRPLWFRRSSAFDAELRARFATDWAVAREGGCGDWSASPEGAVALVLLLDQLPRNLCRGRAEAFASDALARRVADGAIARAFDLALPPVERMFLYLPFEHSEDPEDQARSVALFEAIAERPPHFPRPLRDSLVFFARRHQEIVARFGRFPHRNAALGRTTTAAEAIFLTEAHSSF
jgi:uncharacterized protein (DUF924 family)